MDQNERIADIILDTDEVFDKPKVLDEKPSDYMATVCLAVIESDGIFVVIQKAININDPGETCWFRLPFLKEEDL